MDRPIYIPQSILDTDSNPFIVLASRGFLHTAEEACIAYGLKRDIDYITFRSIPRGEAMIDITCETTHEQMEIQQAFRYIEKIVNDHPFLINITFGVFDDPLKHPLYYEITRYAARLTGCTLNTSLSNDIDLDHLISSKITRLDITVYDDPSIYESIHGVNSWEKTLNTLTHLSEIYHQLNFRILLRIIRTPNPSQETTRKLHQICRKGNFIFSEENPYIEPYDTLLTYCSDGIETDQFKDQKSRLTWNLDQILSFSFEDRYKSCLCQRIFPIIHVNGSVGICHLYRGPTLANEYLTTEWNTLIANRKEFYHCFKCQEFGLHRCDLSVLSDRFETVRNTLTKRTHNGNHNRGV